MISLIAYVGPGPGLSMGWALVALLVTVFGAILAVFLWPLRVMFRRLRGGGEEEAQELPASEKPEELEATPASNAETAAHT